VISPPRLARAAGRSENHSREIKEQGRPGAAFAADIADEYEVADLFHAVDEVRGLDVVVHTAGINRPAALTGLRCDRVTD